MLGIVLTIKKRLQNTYIYENYIISCKKQRKDKELLNAV